MTPAKKRPFFEMLREAREHKGLSVRTVARDAGVSEEVWRDYEAGRQVPLPLTVKKVFGSHHRIMSEVPDRAERAPDPAPPRIKDQDHLSPSPPFEKFGLCLQSLRGKEGSDRRTLASLIGVTASAVEKWEAGETMPVREHMTKLVELFPSLAVFEGLSKDRTKGGPPASERRDPTPTPSTPETAAPAPAGSLTRLGRTVRAAAGEEAYAVLRVTSQGSTLIVARGEREDEHGGSDPDQLVEEVVLSLRREVQERLREMEQMVEDLRRVSEDAEVRK